MTGVASILPLLLFVYYACGQLEPNSIASFTQNRLSEDENNCGNLIRINQQGLVNARETNSNPLLIVDNAVDNKNTIRLLKALYPSLGTNTTARKRFIDAVVGTEVMKRAINYLRSKNKISGNLNEFKFKLERIWFTICKRSIYSSSSAFEHVFMGEVNRRKVGGFHNWIYYNNQQGYINYRGHYYREDFADNKGSLLSIMFEWRGARKGRGSMFVGTSPEIELAIYTTCFLISKGTCHAQFGSINFYVDTLPNDNNTDLICTAFPRK